MAILESILLRIVHSFHFLVVLLTAFRHRFQRTPPLPLQVTRRRTPRHLALLLVSDSSHNSAITQEVLLENVTRTVGWCRAVGIEKLTIFDNEGVLVDCADQISQRASIDADGYDSESDVEYPLTPPPSDYSESRPLSPEDSDSFHKETSVLTIRLHEIPRKQTSKYGLKKRSPKREKLDVDTKPPLTLCIASRQCSKPAIAAAATSLARRRARTTDANQQLNLTVESLNSVLEGPHSLSAPDFLIVHHLRRLDLLPPPLELHGFPPWQIRLTEIHHCYKQQPLLEWLNLSKKSPKDAPEMLTEIDFRTALDEFAGAEMRFGK
ncbi:hypothetical protein DFH07DRAFT_788955 [Mycena maculata]|uniref:ditrans,polycis-polyprenyl diphosphate synthase [(2E,6E)-farnesyldiphosphate specific] n=1 Tax=Mycena maculata TaxID=230809 RepID=A0AAD7P1E8_9AGAR|nr:hypothetical protein DFH07DRAFT_788955 [Mycena maculata]